MKHFTEMLFSLLICGVIPSLSLSTPSSSSSNSIGNGGQRRRSPPPPIVYTIAGSDSGGGAGIQADLHAMHSFGCHGCSAITCLTAQNSVGVTAVHAPPAAFLEEQLDALWSDLPPNAIKIGMLGTKDLVLQVASFIEKVKREAKERGNEIWVVLDPVMISTSGSRLIEEDAQQAMVNELFPIIDLLTPNKFEAEALLDGRKLSSRQDVEQAARDLLNMNSLPAVLIKGGHTLTNKEEAYAQDYFQSRSNIDDEDDSDGYEPRLCDGHRGVWLQSRRYDTDHTHGTGCTLSSAIASALALGQVERRGQDGSTSPPRGSISSIQLVDACCLAKAYVTAGIDQGVGLGQGPGPVRHTQFPQTHEHFPSIVVDDAIPNNSNPPFQRMVAVHHDGGTNNKKFDGDLPILGRILPIVDSEEWIERLCTEPRSGDITDVQLRIKGETDPKRIAEIVKRCQAHCSNASMTAGSRGGGGGGGSIRLWINDYWEAAIEAGCFGVHVGQEDLYRCIQKGGLECLRQANMALGISTHSYSELAVALGIRPSYISVGPIFATKSKTVKFDPQGLETVQQWRKIVPPDTPLVAIGGIGDVDTATAVRRAGADCVAVIGAVTNAPDIAFAVSSLNEAMNRP